MPRHGRREYAHWQSASCFQHQHLGNVMVKACFYGKKCATPVGGITVQNILGHTSMQMTRPMRTPGNVDWGRAEESAVDAGCPKPRDSYRRSWRVEGISTASRGRNQMKQVIGGKRTAQEIGSGGEGIRITITPRGISAGEGIRTHTAAAGGEGISLQRGSWCEEH